ELDLPEQEDKSEEEAEAALDAPELEKLTERFKSVLGDKVTEVRPSKVLRNSPMRLVNPENALNAETYRIQRLMNQDYEVPQKIVELNRSHPLIVNLAHLTTNKPDDAVIDLTIEQLYDSALLQEGLHPNPAEMLPRIEQILAVAVQDELEE
ncbi:MAG TPA: molecular chaperone HtpG, partial [Anaerolineae bacterium]|nr:molecular chaperone HtpG [Anaerolineae bacterium]